MRERKIRERKFFFDRVEASKLTLIKGACGERCVSMARTMTLFPFLNYF